MQGSACGYPGSDEAEQHHGEGDPGEDERVACAGEGDEMREDAGGEHPTDQANRRSAEQDEDGTAERGAHDLEALRAERDADALLFHAFRNGVRGHAEEAGDGEQGSHEAHDAEHRGGGAGEHHGAVDGVVPGKHRDRGGGNDLGERVMERAGDLVLRQLRTDEHVYLAGDDEFANALGVGEEHGGLRIFTEAVVLAVFDDADDFISRLVPHGVMPADSMSGGAEKLAGEGFIDDGDGG